MKEIPRGEPGSSPVSEECPTAAERAGQAFASDRISKGLLLVICLGASFLSLRSLFHWALYRPLDMDELEFFRATRWVAFAGFSSQRAIPGVAVVALLYLFVHPEDRWGFRPKVLWTLCSGLFVATAIASSWAAGGALGIFWNHNVVTNRLYEKLPAGYDLPSFWTVFWSFFAHSSGYRVLGVLAIGGLVLAAWRPLRPTFGLRMALLLGGQIAFLASISSPYGYQLQVSWWLLALLASASIGAFLALRACRAGSARSRCSLCWLRERLGSPGGLTSLPTSARFRATRTTSSERWRR
jgi:hypothetical protein